MSFSLTRIDRSISWRYLRWLYSKNKNIFDLENNRPTPLTEYRKAIRDSAHPMAFCLLCLVWEYITLPLQPAICPMLGPVDRPFRWGPRETEARHCKQQLTPTILSRSVPRSLRCEGVISLTALPRRTPRTRKPLIRIRMEPLPLRSRARCCA